MKSIMTILVAMLAILTLNSVYADVNTDILAVYSADDNMTDGTIAIDGTGQYNATLIGGVTTGASFIDGQAYYIDGVNDYLQTDIPIAATDGTSSFSVCTWINITTIQNPDSNFLFGAIDGSNNGMVIVIDHTPMETFAYWASDGYYASMAELSINTAYHVCLVWNTAISPDDYFIYINGADVTYNSASYAGVGLTTAQLQFGNGVSYAVEPINGYLDEMAVWSVALSAGDVSYLYNDGLGSHFDGSAFVQNQLPSTPNCTESATGDYFYDGFCDGTINNGWTLGYDAIEQDGVMNFGGSGGSIYQNFSATQSIDLGRAFTIKYNSSTMTNSNTQFTRIIISDGINNVYISPEMDTLDSNLNDDIDIQCDGACSCTHAITYSTENPEYESTITYNPLTGVVRLDRNDSLNAETIVSGCDFSQMYISVFGRNGDANVTDFFIDGLPLCTPDWACNGYTACLPENNQTCNSVTDLNTCGKPYTGDYSEFIPQSCDYCIPDWSCTAYAACLPNNTQQCNLVTDTNLCSEPYTGDYSEFPPQACIYGNNQYNQSYQAEDLPAIVIDGLGKFGVVLISMVVLIAMVVLFGSGVKAFLR